jgi:dCTP deaminase
MPDPGFWSTETLKDRLGKERIISPYDASAVNACCYELAVGEEAFVTGESAKKIILKEGDSVGIPPGQVVLILTREMIKMPLNAIGLLSIRFGLKARGLINVSGFHVDPGFEEKLVFSMYNAGVQTIHLSYGSRVFLLWLSSVDKATADKYHGEHNKQEHLPDDAITNLAARMPSPFTLEKDVESLRNELRREVSGLKTILTVAGTLAVAAFLASLRGCGPQGSSTRAGSVDNGSTPLQTSPITIASPTATAASIITPSATVPSDATLSPLQAPRP